MAANATLMVLIVIRVVMLVLLLVIVRWFGCLVGDERLRRRTYVVDVVVHVTRHRRRLMVIMVLLLQLQLLLLQLLILMLLVHIHVVVVLEFGVLHQELYGLIQEETDMTTYNAITKIFREHTVSHTFAYRLMKLSKHFICGRYLYTYHYNIK